MRNFLAYLRIQLISSTFRINLYYAKDNQENSSLLFIKSLAGGLSVI